MANLMGSLIRGAIGVLLVQCWPLNNESNKSFNQSHMFAMQYKLHGLLQFSD